MSEGPKNFPELQPSPKAVRVHALAANQPYLDNRFKELLQARLLRHLAPSFVGDDAGLISAVSRHTLAFATDTGESKTAIGARIASSEIERLIPADEKFWENITPDQWIDAKLQEVVDWAFLDHYTLPD